MFSTGRAIKIGRFEIEFRPPAESHDDAEILVWWPATQQQREEEGESAMILRGAIPFHSGAFGTKFPPDISVVRADNGMRPRYLDFRILHKIFRNDYAILRAFDNGCFELIQARDYN